MPNHQFDRWSGKPREVYDQRTAEGYQIRLETEEQVPAFKLEGWEHMTIEGHEIWWNNGRRDCAYLMRREAPE